MKTKTLSLLLLPLFLLAACDGNSASTSDPSVDPSTSDSSSTSADKEAELRQKISEATAVSSDNFTFDGTFIDYLQHQNYIVANISIEIKFSTPRKIEYTGGELYKDNNWYVFTLNGLEGTDLSVEADPIANNPSKINLNDVFDMTNYTYNSDNNEFELIIDYDEIGSSLLERIEVYINIREVLYKISVGVDENDQVYIKLWNKTSSFDTLKFSNIGTTKLQVLDDYIENVEPEPAEKTMNLAEAFQTIFGGNNYTAYSSNSSNIYASKEAYDANESATSSSSLTAEIKSDNTSYYVDNGTTKNLYVASDPLGYGRYHNDGTAWSELESVSTTTTWQDDFNTMVRTTEFTNDNLSTFLDVSDQTDDTQEFVLKSDITNKEQLDKFLVLMEESSQFNGEITSDNLVSLNMTYNSNPALPFLYVKIEVAGANSDGTYMTGTIVDSFMTFNETTVNVDEILAA